MAEKEKQPGVIMLKGVRLSFADTLYESEKGDNIPKQGKNAGKQPWRNSINLLLADKNSELGEQQKKACMKAMKDAKDATWPGDDQPKIKGDKLALRDGDEENWDGYADRYFVSAGNTVYTAMEADRPKRPYRVIGPKKVKDPDTGNLRFPDVREGEPNAPYSGCYVNAKIRFWGMDNEHGKRINASIEAIQFAKHGEAFGGGVRTNVDDEFDEEDDDDFGGDDDLDGGSEDTGGDLDI